MHDFIGTSYIAYTLYIFAMLTSKYRSVRNVVLLDMCTTLVIAGITILTVMYTIRGLRYATRVMKTVKRALTYTPSNNYEDINKHHKLDDASKSIISVQLKSDSVDWYSARYVIQLIQRFTSVSCRKDKVISNDYDDLGFKLLCTIGQRNVVGIAGLYGTRLWIALRGAHTPHEFQKMAKLSQQPVKVSSSFCDRANLTTLFHSGLVDLYQHIKADIEDILNSGVMRTCTSIVVGGYSMGSGLATLTALHIESMYPGMCTTYLVGGPRIANHAMARQIQLILNERIVRIVNEDDLICNVPLVNWPDLSSPNGIVEYTHVGKVGLLFYAYKGSLTLSHGIQNYLDAIEAAAKGPSVLSKIEVGELSL